MGEFDELIKEFVTESREHIADIEDDLIKIEADMENVDPEVINRVFRAAHSIKGSARFLDLMNIGELAHNMEDVLNLIRSGKLVPSSEIANPLLQAADMLKSMFEDVMSSNNMDITEHINHLQAIINTTQKDQKSAAGKKEVTNLDIIQFDVDKDTLEKKVDTSQVYIFKKLDQKTLNGDDFMKELENIGEILATKEEPKGKVSILFASIMEPNMIPVALGLNEKSVLEVSANMIPSIIKAAPVMNKKEKIESTPKKVVKTQKTPEPKIVVKKEVKEIEDYPEFDEDVEIHTKVDFQPPLTEEEIKEENTSFITFSLEKETYAVPIQMIEEIIGLQDISLLPNVPGFIKGVINLRGELVPIMDLRLKFGLIPKEYNPLTVFLIVRVNERVMGMVVDNVADVLVIDPLRVQRSPSFSAKISTDFIEGVYKDTQDQMVILVDLPSLIKPEEWEA